MAMYDVKFKSFKEIEAYWRGVKPIRGRKEDVRPIADRARHWERVNLTIPEREAHRIASV